MSPAGGVGTDPSQTTASEFFHVAPAESLSPGQRAALHRPANLRAEQGEVLDSWFPEGVTHWGEVMLLTTRGVLALGPSALIGLNGLTGQNIAAATAAGGLELSPLGVETLNDTRNRVIEMTFELVRRVEFPTKPSRLQCVFAYRTLDEARNYRAVRRDPQSEEIWCLSCDRAERLHVGDGRWLIVPYDALSLWYMARGYWSEMPYPYPSSVPADEEVLIPTENATFAVVKVAPGN